MAVVKRFPKVPNGDGLLLRGLPVLGVGDRIATGFDSDGWLIGLRLLCQGEWVGRWIG